jgi:hypothetical protein
MAQAVVEPIRSRNECALPPEELFDESLGYDDETGIKMAEGLTAEERAQAVRYYRMFNELWGVMVVLGDPGTGKDLFGNYLSWKLKRFFPWKRILRDEKPRALYGNYGGLFNESIIQSDLEKMRKIATGVSAVKVDDMMEKAADDWIQGAGEVMLKNSVLYLTEFWRYCYNREPHAPMNKTMGAIHKVKRHLDCLVIGTTQLISELDRKTAKPWIDWRVTCTKSMANPTGFIYYVQKVHYDRRQDVLVDIGKPFPPIAFDAGKPRPDIGDGKIRLVKPGYRPMSEEERIVLEVLKAGADDYETLVDVIEDAGDMCEREVLATLKGLKFTRSKRVVEYNCFFGIYNSKSAPQIRSSVKQMDE